MQVRQVIAAALLAATAVGAMAQEIDRSETLQAKNLAAQQAPSAVGRTRESVRAETRNEQAAGSLKTIGERSDASPVPAAPASATGLTRAQVKADLAQWRLTHKQDIGERG